jgi:hypothetical protein
VKVPRDKVLFIARLWQMGDASGQVFTRRVGVLTGAGNSQVLKLCKNTAIILHKSAIKS